MKISIKERTVRRFSWWEYCLTFLLFAVLSALPPIMYGGLRLIKENSSFAIWYILYWLIVTALFCSITAFQKYKRLDAPMRKLGEAARKVSSGDFSVYLTPEHRADKMDYIDRMYLDFNTMVEELGSIEVLKNDFVSNVSHEIKSPLAVIESYAHALKSDALSKEERQEYTDTIIEYSRKLTSLVANILKLNKLENQIIDFNIRKFNLCEQIRECVLEFEEKWEEKDIDIIVDIEDSVMICADQSMLEIVWHNLISNAIKFTDRGGKIIVSQCIDEDFVSISVKDSGCGMNDETRRRLFDKFYQGDTSHSSEGNGLGLTLAYRVVELMSGALSVESEEGKGSTFTVKLPLHQINK